MGALKDQPVCNGAGGACGIPSQSSPSKFPQGRAGSGHSLLLWFSSEHLLTLGETALPSALSAVATSTLEQPASPAPVALTMPRLFWFAWSHWGPHKGLL